MYGPSAAYVTEGYAPAPSGWRGRGAPTAAGGSTLPTAGNPRPVGKNRKVGVHRGGTAGPPPIVGPGAAGLSVSLLSPSARSTSGAARAGGGGGSGGGSSVSLTKTISPRSAATAAAISGDTTLYAHSRVPPSPVAAAAVSIRGSPQHQQQTHMGNAAIAPPTAAAVTSPLPPLAPAGYAAVPVSSAAAGLGGGGTSPAAAGPYGSSTGGYRRSLLAPPPGQPQPAGATSSGSKRAGGRCFLVAVMFLIAFLYFGYVFGLLLPMLWPFPSPGGVLLFFVFHCCFFLLLCAFFKAVFTDPGRVPANWGFYMGDENKRRRYCKVCDVWKPDRTHHCSACGRCVLNMDHHCPWINNCVGFYNRKYFIQLLVYALISLFLIFCHGFYFIFMESLRTGTQLHYGRPPRHYTTATTTGGEAADLEQQHAPWNVLRYVYVCLILFVSMILIFALIPFSRFHMNLVLRNSTTIENMDVANRDRNRYDLGVSRNVEQVFGANPCCWLIPLQSVATRPVGDGVRWSMHYMVANDDQKFWKNGTGFLGAGGLGLDAALGQTLRGSGGLLTAGPAAIGGMVDGIFSSLAPDLKPPVQTLLSPKYCEPTKLKQPSNIVTPGGYLVTPDMPAWVPPGPARVVSLPHISRRGRIYVPPSLSDPILNPLPILGKLLETNSSEILPPTNPQKSLPKVSLNGDLIDYNYQTNELGETVLAAHSVYESNISKVFLDSTDISADRETLLAKEDNSQHISSSESKISRQTNVLDLAAECADFKETDASRLKPGCQRHDLPTKINSKSLRNKVEVDEGPAAAQATESLASFLQTLSMLNVSKLGEIMGSLTEETFGRSPVTENGPKQRRLATEGVLEALRPDKEFGKNEENIDELLTLGIAAAAKLKRFFPKSRKPEGQSPIQYGLNVLNAKANVQIECRTPVVRTYTPLGVVILNLRNTSFTPSIIRNDLFTAYIQENQKNRRLPIVSVVDASTFKNVERDYIVLVCGRPGRFVSYFLVGITFVFGDAKQATNICPVEFFCEEGKEVPADEIAIYFRTKEKKQLLPRSDERNVSVGYMDYSSNDELSADDYDVPTPARNRFPGAVSISSEKQIVTGESFTKDSDWEGDGLEEYWGSFLARLYPFLF